MLFRRKQKEQKVAEVEASKEEAIKVRTQAIKLKAEVETQLDKITEISKDLAVRIEENHFRDRILVAISGETK